jgi:hypothetical protein
MTDQKIKAPEFSTALTRVNDAYFPLIERQLQGNGVVMDGYSKQCVITAIAAMNAVLDSKGINWNHPDLDKNNITLNLLAVASLKLNSAASPREVFFQLRNTRLTVKGENNKDTTVWKKQIEMGIEGDGNDSILARFGRDVKKVGQFWMVREGDEFEYPKYNGFEVTPPKWTPTGKGQVVRVVYPVVKNDGTYEYYIGEREDVARNLFAHINNNLMNETFGIAESRFKANDKQSKEIKAKKAEVLKKARELGLAALDEPELEPWISPAWTEYHSREQMIIRKMRNNVVKKIPKDFGNAYIEMTYQDSTDEDLKRVNREIAENANTQTIDVQGEVVDETEDGSDQSDPAEPEKPKQEPPKQDQSAQGKPEQITLGATGTEGPGF